MKVGDTVWYKTPTYEKGDDLGLRESTIKTIGRKYITITNGWREKRFFKESLLCADDHSSGVSLYFDRAERKKEIELLNAKEKACKFFRNYNWHKGLSISALNKINEIIDSEKPNDQ